MPISKRSLTAFKESVADMQSAGFFPQAGQRDRVHWALHSRAVSRPAIDVHCLLTEEIPVTEPQLEVWLSDQLSDEASCCFNESFSLRMKGKVNETAMKEAVRAAGEPP